MEELVRRGDPEELLLEVDRLAAQRDWDGLAAMRRHCEAALEYGRQLWAVAQYIDYRLALEAPGPHAARACESGGGRFTLGPLTEVAAQGHTWEELADHIEGPWVAATVAQERVLRGEQLSGDPRAHPEELEPPLELLDWEPDYPLPTYRSHDLLEGGPSPVTADFVATGGDIAGPADQPRLVQALGELGSTWAEQSNGGSHVAAVRGDAAAAARQVLPEARIAPIEPADAVARLAWAAASGGAYGRRAGMAAGRSSALWIATLATRMDHPADPDRLGERIRDLEWWLMGEEDAGWRIGLVIADPVNGWAAAVHAWDTEDAGPPVRRTAWSET